jgi:hypothetical protein
MIWKIFREIKYDLKEMGLNLVSVIAILASLVFLSVILKNKITNQYYMIAIINSLYEFIIPTLGGYCSVILMQGLYDSEGGDLLFTYSRSYFYWGILRQLRFFIIYIILIVAVFYSTSIFISEMQSGLLVLLILQSFAVMGFSFMGTTISKKVSVGLIFLVIFVGIQIMVGREFAFLNWIYKLEGNIRPSRFNDGALTINSAIIGSISFLLGNIWIKKKE